MRLGLPHPVAHLVQSQVRSDLPQDAVLHIHIECDAHLFAWFHENAAGGKCEMDLIITNDNSSNYYTTISNASTFKSI